MDFRAHGVKELAADVQAGRRTARELVEAALARIDLLDSELNAFVAVEPALALAEADQVDQRVKSGESLGLAGIPLGVKDLEDAAGYPTRYGSLVTDDRPVGEDSVLVARLKAAGCVVVGKTTTPEYGHKGMTESPQSGITRNPWDLERSPAGSSGGSAAALAAGIVPLATGSDGGGSIRLPAAICGLAGMKVTNGLVPNGGSNPPGSGLLSVKGPMARGVGDTAYALDHCVGVDPTDPFSLPAPSTSLYTAAESAQLPPAVIWAPTLGFADVDDEVAAVCQRAVDLMAGSGVQVIEVTEVWDDPMVGWLTMWIAGRARAHGHLLDTDDFALLDNSLQQMTYMGAKSTGADYARAVDAIHLLSLELVPLFAQAPVLLTPTVAGQAPRVSTAGGTINGVLTPRWVEFTPAFNVTRHPAGSVNVGFVDAGLPVGLQVVAPHHHDAAVIETMAAIEALVGISAHAPFG